MQIIKLKTNVIEAIINQAITVLRGGGLVIYPTETVYGLGVDATNHEAVGKLMRFKARREGKPLSIAVSDKTMAQKYVQLNEQAKNLYQQFLPGPVTVVSRGLGQVAKGVESEFGTLGVRIPNYSLILDLIKQFGKPITATSANASGKPRPYTIETIFKYLSRRQQALIDLVIDAGQLPKNPPSTVIDTTLSTPVVMRNGKVGLGSTADQDQHQKTNSYQPLALEFITRSAQETQGLAGRLLLKHWQNLQQTGLVFALDGPLGAGKTTFTQGLAQYLGIDEPIVSPTYTYMQEYNWQKNEAFGKLYHLDLWRIDNTKVLDRLGIDELIEPYNLVVIEWWQQGAEVLKPMIKAKKARLVEVKLENVRDERRKISIDFV